MAKGLPRYRCNAEHPGSLVAGVLIAFGQEFTCSPSEPPRNMWIPLNAAAEQAFKDWNEKSVPRLVEEEIKKKRLVGAKADELRAELTERLKRISNPPITKEERLPDDEIADLRARLEEKEAQRAAIIERRLPPAAVDVEAPKEPEKASGKGKRTADQ